MTSVADHFDRHVETYERTSAIQELVFTKLLSQVLNFSPSSILDFGCGTGAGTYRLHQQFPDATIIGSDSSPKMSDYARQKYTDPSLTFCTTPLSALSGPFDLIISSSCLHWMPCLSQSFSEIYELMSPSSRMAVTLFGPGTYQELQTCISAVLGTNSTISSTSFLGASEVFRISKKFWPTAQFKTVRIQTSFSSLLSLLRSIQRSGTTGYGIRPSIKLTKGRLQSLSNYYLDRYSHIKVTYQVFLIVV